MKLARPSDPAILRKPPHPEFAPSSKAGNASSDSLPARYQDSFAQQRGLSAKANQALAAYGSTSAYTEERDASEVLGLDLYA